MIKLTKPQSKALLAKWQQRDASLRANAGCKYGLCKESFLAFRRTAIPAFMTEPDVIAVPWCGMWLVIETDGYCHS